MVLLALETPGHSARLGLSVPLRVGTAPVRNRAKRRLRDIFRRFPFPERGGRDLCVMVKPEASTASYTDLREEFNRLCRKAFSSGRSSAS